MGNVIYSNASPMLSCILLFSFNAAPQLKLHNYL